MRFQRSRQLVGMTMSFGVISSDAQQTDLQTPMIFSFARRVAAICGLLLALGMSSAVQAEEADEDSTTTQESAQVDPLLEYVNRAINLTSRRFLDAQGHTPWQVLHGLLALREDYVIMNRGQKVNALEWISTEARFRGTPWIEKTKDGARVHPYNGEPYEFEGHVNQSLAVIAMCNLPLDHEFTTASGEVVTMQDMVNHAKMNVNSLEEITWTLWFLTRYLDQDEEWINNKNEPWSMERLVRMQVKDSPYDSPCGGTHGMFALAFARNAYMKKHGQLRGAWLEADQKLQRYITTVRRMQNQDGSFSTNWFKSTGYSTDVPERLNHSGHTIEWLMVALPKSELSQPWFRSGVRTLSDDILRSARISVDGKKVGGLYHALHALVLYREMMSPKTPGSQIPNLAASEKTTTQPTTPARIAQDLGPLPELGRIEKDPTTPATTNDVAMPVRVSEGNDYSSRAQRRAARRQMRALR